MEEIKIETLLFSRLKGFEYLLLICKENGNCVHRCDFNYC